MKPPRLVLDIAKQIHVFDPMNRRFQMAVHDGRGGRDAKAVSGGDDINPLLDRDAAGRNDIADLLVENFGRRSWQRSQSGRSSASRG